MFLNISLLIIIEALQLWWWC